MAISIGVRNLKNEDRNAFTGTDKCSHTNT